MLKPLALLLLACLPAFVQDTPVELTPEVIAEHPEAITRLAVGPKGKVLFTADSSSALRAWDLKKQKFLWETDPRPKAPKILALGASEDALATCVGAPTYSLTSTEDGEALDGATAALVQGSALSLVIEPKGRWIWLGLTSGGAVRLQPGNVNGWSKRTMKNGGTLSMAMDAKAKDLALGGKDGSVRFINPTSSKKDEKRLFQVHSDPITALSFGPKSKKLAVGAADGSLTLIDTKKGKELLKLEGHKAAITALAIDPKGRWLASGDAKGQLLLWELKKGTHPATLKTEAEGPVAGICFLDKGARLVTSNGGNSLQLWSTKGL